MGSAPLTAPPCQWNCRCAIHPSTPPPTNRRSGGRSWRGHALLKSTGTRAVATSLAEMFGFEGMSGVVTATENREGIAEVHGTCRIRIQPAHHAGTGEQHRSHRQLILGLILHLNLQEDVSDLGEGIRCRTSDEFEFRPHIFQIDVIGRARPATGPARHEGLDVQAGELVHQSHVSEHHKKLQ